MTLRRSSHAKLLVLGYLRLFVRDTKTIKLFWQILMISKPTVLILGAGASFHAGYPIGMQLVTQICTNNSRPVIGPLPTRWSNDDWNSFTTRLSRSAHSSIDAFLELSHADANLRKNDADLGKFLIAQTLKQNEISKSNQKKNPTIRVFLLTLANHLRRESLP